jgi:ankyrin repeat protein
MNIMSVELLHYAIRNGDMDSVSTILDANPGLIHKTYLGSAALHIAAEYNQTAIVKDLIARGADISQPGYGDNLPLHYAAMSGATDAIALLATPENINMPHKTTDEPPLHLAIRHGHLATARAILQTEGCNPDVVSGKSNIGEALAVMGMADGMFTPLLSAIEFGMLEIIPDLAAAGADLNKSTILGSPVVCALNKHPDVVPT